MRIQQAIFTSSDRGQIKGYQLVAMSEGIDRSVAKELYRWSPSHMGDDDPANWTINYFPISEDLVAIARSVLGGPEYSSRGGLQVVTLIAVLHNKQFAAYDNNAMQVAKTALALGWLRIPKDMPSRLQAFDLPDYPLKPATGNRVFLKHRAADRDAEKWSTSSEDFDEFSLLRELTELLNANKRLAIIGAPSPIELVAKLISHLSPEERREFSFTTGLPPALHRPFQAHFLPDVDRALNQLLKSDGITVVQARHGEPVRGF